MLCVRVHRGWPAVEFPAGLNPFNSRNEPGLLYGLAAATSELAGTSSFSMTARQGTLSFALLVRMQAVIFGMFGISELQRRNASPVHAARASALKAKHDDEAAAETDKARAALRQILRMTLVGRIGFPRCYLLEF
jgi:hypothetical protein